MLPQCIVVMNDYKLKTKQKSKNKRKKNEIVKQRNAYSSS